VWAELVFLALLVAGICMSAARSVPEGYGPELAITHGEQSVRTGTLITFADTPVWNPSGIAAARGASMNGRPNLEQYREPEPCCEASGVQIAHAKRICSVLTSAHTPIPVDVPEGPRKSY
jgi:hypothetical protein